MKGLECGLTSVLLGILQEYYIRHVDGCPVNSEAERQRVIQCLEAAIERRVSEVRDSSFPVGIHEIVRFGASGHEIKMWKLRVAGVKIGALRR